MSDSQDLVVCPEEFCGKTLKRKSMPDHMLRHGNEKLFSCITCEGECFDPD